MPTSVLVVNLRAFFYYYVCRKKPAICSLLSCWSSLKVAAVNVDIFENDDHQLIFGYTHTYILIYVHICIYIWFSSAPSATTPPTTSGTYASINCRNLTVIIALERCSDQPAKASQPALTMPMTMQKNIYTTFQHIVRPLYSLPRTESSNAPQVIVMTCKNESKKILMKKPNSNRCAENDLIK